MKFQFLYAPTSDLEASVALYRDGLGCEEIWREGESTVALAMPGTDVQLMLDANDPDASVGPIFVVDDVHAFHAGRPTGLQVVDEPSEIPGGVIAVYEDPAGVTVHVMDQSTDPSTD